MSSFWIRPWLGALGGLVSSAAALGDWGSLNPIVFEPVPLSFPIAPLGAELDAFGITDIEAADFSGDGLTDLAVAWFTTDDQNITTRVRRITFLRSDGRTLLPWTEINAYKRDTFIEARSIFRNGTGELAAGDFDGDGDADLAALPYAGDEMWLIENLGGGQFLPHAKFMYGVNSTGQFSTPPEAAAADFDGDGRDDLVYLVDPSARIDGTVHFWGTSSTISAMARRPWGAVDSPVMTWARGLAVGDFDADQQLDLAFCGSAAVDEQSDPRLNIWTGFSELGVFQPQAIALPFLPADVEAFPGIGCGDDLVVTDLQIGNRVARLAAPCASGGPWLTVETYAHFQPTAVDRGNVLASGDLNGDLKPDLVIRKRSGFTSHQRQVEYLADDGFGWVEVDQLIDSPFENNGTNQILRPRNLAVAQLFGSSRPEIIAAFNPTAEEGVLGPLVVRVWTAGCELDVTGDGQTTVDDLFALLSQAGLCAGQPGFEPIADLNHDGCIDDADASLLLNEFGCSVIPFDYAPGLLDDF